MNHTDTARDLPVRATARTVRLDRGGRKYLIAGRVAATVALVEVAVCAEAVRRGWLTFDSWALPLLTALLVLLFILTWVFPHRADQIDGTYTVAEDLGPAAGGGALCADDAFARQWAAHRRAPHPGEGSGAPLAIEGATR